MEPPTTKKQFVATPFFPESGQNITRSYKWSADTVASKSTRKNQGAALFPPPNSPLLAWGRCYPKIKKKVKRGGEVLNLISFCLKFLDEVRLF